MVVFTLSPLVYQLHWMYRITSCLMYLPQDLPMFYDIGGIPYAFHVIKTLWLSPCCEGTAILQRREDFQQTRWWGDIFWSDGSLVIKKVTQGKTPLYYLGRVTKFTTYLGHCTMVVERLHCQQTCEVGRYFIVTMSRKFVLLTGSEDWGSCSPNFSICCWKFHNYREDRRSELDNPVRGRAFRLLIR